MPVSHANAKIYTVSQLTAEIKSILEQRFAFVWLGGEISNFRIPSSGHFYFTLKDDTAQIQAVMFRGQNRHLTFQPEDGMAVTGLGRISVYEPRGNYQIIFEYLEPKGIGALQVAFEQLKRRLDSEGLFDPSHKKPIPFLPKRLGIVTSPTGAVIHDILNVVERRFPGLGIDLVPVKVQGEGAIESIVSGLKLLEARNDVDVILLARGGGSLEDLQAFNSEAVARAVFAASIPVISAVGHETDYTIADFVADLRAPTPSAAAELAVPMEIELKQKIYKIQNDITYYIRQHIREKRSYLNDLSRRVVDPKKRLDDLRLRLDDYNGRLRRFMDAYLQISREKLQRRTDNLLHYNPLSQVKTSREYLDTIHHRLYQGIRLELSRKFQKFEHLQVQLETLSPTSILARGYSITRTLPEKRIVRDVDAVHLNQNLEILLAKGSLTCEVREKSKNG
jgi:exodeoxyribonuclease VII large subunit